MAIKRLLLIVFAISVLATASLAADEQNSPRKPVSLRKHSKVTPLNDGPIKIDHHKRFTARKNQATSLNNDSPIKIDDHKRFTFRRNQATSLNNDGPKIDYRKRIAARKHLKAAAAAASSLDGRYLKRIAAARKHLKAASSADGPKIDYQKLIAARKHRATSLNGKKVTYREPITTHKNLDGPKIDYQKLIAARKNRAAYRKRISARKTLDGPKIDYQKLIAARKHLSSKDASDKEPSTVKPVAAKLPISEMRKRMIARRNRRSSTHGFKFLPSFNRVGANKPMTMAPAPAPTMPFPLPLPPSPSPCASEKKP